MNIGQKIKQARLAKGLTQEDLGEILGLQKSAVAKYESGRVVNIKRSTLIKISTVLDIPPAELISEEDRITLKDEILSFEKQQLIDYIKTIPDDKIHLVLKVVKAIAENS